MSTFQLEIVSAEQEIFKGDVKNAHFTGAMGKMEILPGHTPLLTCLIPGMISYKTDTQQAIYVSGGFLEVQPHRVYVLADVVERETELDEQLIEDSINQKRHELSSSEVEYSTALAQLAELSAKIQLIQHVRKLRK